MEFYLKYFLFEVVSVISALKRRLRIYEGSTQGNLYETMHTDHVLNYISCKHTHASFKLNEFGLVKYNVWQEWRVSLLTLVAHQNHYWTVFTKIIIFCQFSLLGEMVR